MPARSLAAHALFFALLVAAAGCAHKPKGRADRTSSRVRAAPGVGRAQRLRRRPGLFRTLSAALLSEREAIPSVALGDGAGDAL